MNHENNQISDPSNQRNSDGTSEPSSDHVTGSCADWDNDFGFAQRRLSDKDLRELGEMFPTESRYWAKFWTASLDAYRHTSQGLECWENYDDDEIAASYYERIEGQDKIDPITESIFDMVKPGWSVLDIGAGPGNYTVPIAKAVSSVTAVEPAAAMARVLQKNFDTEGLTNTRVIQKLWEDVDVEADLGEKFDLVLCSYAFGMADLDEMVDKVLAVAADEVVFVWFAGLQYWDIDGVALWKLLHDKEITPAPKGLPLYNYLYTRGIYPDVQVVNNSFETYYDSIETALDVYMKRYKVAPDDNQAIAKLRSYLESVMTPSPKGIRHKHPTTSMKLSFSIKDL